MGYSLKDFQDHLERAQTLLVAAARQSGAEKVATIAEAHAHAAVAQAIQLKRNAD